MSLEMSYVDISDPAGMLGGVPKKEGDR